MISSLTGKGSTPEGRSERKSAPAVESILRKLYRRVFATKSSVIYVGLSSRNMSTHTPMCEAKEPTMPCSTCGKLFRTTFQLKKHESTHVRDVECEDCGMMFGLEKQLKNHKLRKHTPDSERPFQCK